MAVKIINKINGLMHVFYGMAVVSKLNSAEPVTVTVSAHTSGPELPSRFLGLSYETAMLLPRNGRYYFDSNDRALVNTFQVLGIKSLRVGANAVDDPRIPIPQEKDIDMLFKFAWAAGVKVIYSFRLENGDPANSARLAGYIAAKNADALDSFSIGNEADFYLPTFEAYFAKWKPHYDAILQAVPNAMFDGPNSRKNISTPWTWLKLCLPADIWRWRAITIISSDRAGKVKRIRPRPGLVFFPTVSIRIMKKIMPGSAQRWPPRGALPD